MQLDPMKKKLLYLSTTAINLVLLNTNTGYHQSFCWGFLMAYSLLMFQTYQRLDGENFFALWRFANRTDLHNSACFPQSYVGQLIHTYGWEDSLIAD